MKKSSRSQYSAFGIESDDSVAIFKDVHKQRISFWIKGKANEKKTSKFLKSFEVPGSQSG